MERQQTSLSSTKDPPRRIPISKTSNPIQRYWWGEINITSSFTAKWSSTLLCKSWWEIRANKMVASGSPKLVSNYLLQGRNTKQLSKTQNPHLNWMIFWNFKPSPKSLKTHLPILVDKIEAWWIYIYIYIYIHNFFQSSNFLCFIPCKMWNMEHTKITLVWKALQVENIKSCK